MGKKVREYKAGDFIFAKVKGYPAWPARVQRMNGKKYFVYFYGTAETANLAPNMIFDYAENKDKFLTKTVKRRDFNDGVKQIEHDFANNVPLEQVIGAAIEAPDATGNESINDTTANDTMDETGFDTTAADESMAEDTTVNTSTNNTAMEDSDENGTLVIDEGMKGKKKPEAKAKETPAKTPKEPKTPRGKPKKEEQAKEDEEDAKKEEEIISRSGRKIRPKRYIDEQTEENATLPSPAPKKRRGASPTAPEKEKEKSAEPKDKAAEKNVKAFNAVSQSELEDLKEPFKSEDAEKDNLLITYLPSGDYVGIKLFQSRPNSFKNEAARLQWDKQAAANAVTLKMQLEKGQITSQSVLSQLVTDLNLTDEEKATLDKERETEEKKCRVQFLKTEMKLIELDAKIKTCLCLEKADTDLCVKLLDELSELNVKPLMLLKHPTCLETIKRMRAYIGNTSSWDLSENAAILFNKQAQKIRRQADALYKNLKEMFTTPDGLSFWEFFTERVLQFKKITANLSADELLEMIHEPIELSAPTSHTMKSAIDAANEEEKTEKTADDTAQKKKAAPAKQKKTPNNTPKPPLKRQSSRKLQQEEKDSKEPQKEDTLKSEQKENSEAEPSIADTVPEITPEETNKIEENSEASEKEVENPPEEKKSDGKEESDTPSDKESKEKEAVKSSQESDKEKDEKDGEPRAKRSRESKKTEAPPQRSPAKRKSKS